MLQTLLPEEMKALESDYMKATGVPSILLMEKAAQAVADAVARHAPQSAAVLFLCGPGNNGGDGYAAARLWAERGGRAAIWELSGSAHGDAGTERFLARQAGIPIRLLREEDTAESLCPASFAAVVDALFGTGLSRPVEGAARRLIGEVNRSGLPVVAVDIPSGLNGATGEELGGVGGAVRAAETVTFHRPKPGLYLRQGCVCAGRVTVAPILIPADWGAVEGLSVLEEKDLAQLIPDRAADAHKGVFGRSVLFAGSTGMAGAAALCAMACVRAGAGLTTVLCRRQVLPVVQTLCPGATCVLLLEAENGSGKLLPEAADTVRSVLRDASRAAIGPGLGQDETLLPVLRAFREAECPVIWDADALNLLALHGEAASLLPLKPQDIVTPHPGEAARLLGQSVSLGHRASAGGPASAAPALRLRRNPQRRAHPDDRRRRALRGQRRRRAGPGQGRQWRHPDRRPRGSAPASEGQRPPPGGPAGRCARARPRRAAGRGNLWHPQHSPGGCGALHPRRLNSLIIGT